MNGPMNRRRSRGYSLVQLLIVIMTLPMLFVILDKMFWEIALDLPKSSQVVSQNERLMKCLESVEQDMVDAVALPATHGQWQQNDKTLLIQLPETLVAYVLSERGVSRQVLEPEDRDAKRMWPIPLARVQWTCQPDNGHATRVEVNTGVLHVRRKKQQLKNSRVFFVDVDGSHGGLQ